MQSPYSFCSTNTLAMPPQRGEAPRTKRKLEKMDTNKEYLTTSTLFSGGANIGTINSLAFPNVGFNNPPTAIRIRIVDISFNPLSYVDENSKCISVLLDMIS